MGSGGVQLPNDVVAMGYRQVKPYHHEQVFYSPSLNFTGIEQEFIDAGHAYRYYQVNDYERVEVR